MLALASTCACGDDAIIVNDDGISSGGVKLEVVNPERGSVLGGNNVLLEGSGLGGNNVVVAFGEVAATDVVVLSAEALLVVAPPGVDPGAVDIVVANAQGFAQRNVAYVYNDPPAITAVDPAEGPRVGGTTVTVTGTGFQEFDPGQNLVTFDGEPADGVTLVSDTELTVVTPPGMPSALAAIDVSNDNGSATLPDAYLYQANGLYAVGANSSECPDRRGNSGHPGAFVFIDLDDGSLFDLGTDRPAGFTRIASDDEGGLVGLEGCTQDLYQIDPDAGTSTLLVDTNYDFLTGRHISGLLRDGNDYIVKDPNALDTFARLSLSSGNITPIGGGPGSGNRRDDLTREGARAFLIGTLVGGASGFKELDLTTGSEIGSGINIPGELRGGAIHRGDLFVGVRFRFGVVGKGGGNLFGTRILRVNRTTGDSQFAALVPAHLSGLTSGDL